MKPLKTQASRREFLQSAVAGASLAAALPAAAVAAPTQEPRLNSAAQDPLEQALRRYGSEFGDITQIRPGE